MPEKLPVEFGPADADGFKTFSLYTPDGAEAVRVSVHVENHRQYFVANAGDLTDRYLASEREKLRDAAALASARQDAHKAGPIDENTALEAILRLLPEFIVADVEMYFPMIALEALQVAGDACAKHALNRTVEAMGAPPMYDEAFADLLLEDLKRVVMRGLNVRRGRPVGTYDHMEKTRQALRRLSEDGDARVRLAGKQPSSEDVASQVVNGGTDERTVRRWAEAVGMTWEEWLRACGWREGGADTN